MLRTRVYIDGYNLYYGCLKNTPFKWLDLLALFEQQILPAILVPGGLGPSILEPQSIKFFTAPILEKAAKNADSMQSQEQYHAALRKHKPTRVEVICGYYSITEVHAKAVDVKDAKKWPRDCKNVAVWKMEEKQTDVNIAIHALKDALLDQVDQVVIVTNDTDLAPALEMIRANTSTIIGLVVPTTDGQRIPNADLVKHSHWVKTHITASELQGAQLPTVVRHSKRSAVKPVSWHPYPDQLTRALQLGIIEKGSKGAAYKWLDNPNPNYQNQTPLELIDAGNGGQVIKFMENWIASKNATSAKPPQSTKTQLFWNRLRAYFKSIARCLSR